LGYGRVRVGLGYASPYNNINKIMKIAGDAKLGRIRKYPSGGRTGRVWK
jgi:hypothetical protein